MSSDKGIKARDNRGGLTRREFIRGAAGAALVGATGLLPPHREVRAAPGEPAQAVTSRVVLVRDRNVLDKNRRPDPKGLARMADDGISALLGQEDPSQAWGRLFSTGDVVGIKSNAWRFLPTPGELEEILRQRLKGAGVADENIGVDDRGVLYNPVFGRSTALINVRPMRTHYWSGVGSCLKNYIMFHPRPPAWHRDACADLAGLWELPAVKGKTRLNILVMLTPLFHGKGPHHYQSRYTWDYRGLIIGTDPVAVDATGLRILEAKRREFFGGDQPLAVSPKHIRVAEEKFKLGVADPSRIELVKIGWQEGALI
jgi:hypothetical protein